MEMGRVGGGLYTRPSWCLPGVGGGMSRLHGVCQVASDGVDRPRDGETHLDYPRTAGRWFQARIRGVVDE